MWSQGLWTNGKKSVSGMWTYVWSANLFVIELDSTDRITGRPRRIETTNDTPEWGNWKLNRSSEAAREDDSR